MSEEETLLNLINKTCKSSKDENVLLGVGPSLWIILFILILSQKVFKYIIKPRRQALENTNNETNNPTNTTANRDSSVECLIV